MTIGLQGTWSVSVTTKDASWAQRFVIEGSDNSVDGTYNGTVGNTVLVTGDQWGVTIENNPTGPVSWQSSRARLANFRVDGGFFRVDIESDDGGGGPDEDFNDLILTASKPLSAAGLRGSLSSIAKNSWNSAILRPILEGKTPCKMLKVAPES